MCVNYFYPFFCEEINRLKVVTIVGKDSRSCCIWSQCTNLSLIYLLPYLIWCVCLSFKTQCSTWQIKGTISSSYYSLPQRQWPSQKCFEQALACTSYILTWGLALMAFYWFLSFASFALGMRISRFTKFGGTHLLCQHVESRGRRITIAQGQLSLHSKF